MKNCPGGSASCGGRVPAHCLSRVASHCPRKQLHASLRPQSTLQGTLWLECLDMRHDMIWYMTWLNCIWLSNDWFCYLATGSTYIWYWRVTPPTSATPSTPGSTMSLPLLHSGWTALSLDLYIIFLSFLYFVSRFGHSLVPATLLSMVEGKSNRRPKQISLKEVFLAKAQHCPPSMILNHRL